MTAVVAAMAVALSATTAPAQSGSVAPKAMRRWAPELARDTDRTLYGDVWRDPSLSARDRSLVTVAVLVATGRTGPLAGHMERALDNGVAPRELSGAIAHLAYYSGWPSAVAALDVMDGVMRKHSIAASSLDVVTPRSPLPVSDGERSRAVRETIAPTAPELAALTDDLLFGDVWRRGDLAPRDRSLVTIAALAAAGDADQLAFHIRLGLRNGLTRGQIAAELTHLAFYAGWPKAVAGVAVLAETADASATAKPVGVEMVPANVEPAAAPADRFTGRVTVSSPFGMFEGSRLDGATVSFAPSARTNWHSHPGGQLLVATEGEGRLGTADGAVRTLRVGDVVWTPPDVMHWHGAAPATGMTHVAASEAVPGRDVEWGKPVTDSQYGAGPR